MASCRRISVANEGSALIWPGSVGMSRHGGGGGKAGVSRMSRGTGMLASFVRSSSRSPDIFGKKLRTAPPVPPTRSGGATAGSCASTATPPPAAIGEVGTDSASPPASDTAPSAAAAAAAALPSSALPLPPPLALLPYDGSNTCRIAALLAATAAEAAVAPLSFAASRASRRRRSRAFSRAAAAASPCSPFGGGGGGGGCGCGGGPAAAANGADGTAAKSPSLCPAVAASCAVDADASDTGVRNVNTRPDPDAAALTVVGREDNADAAAAVAVVAAPPAGVVNCEAAANLAALWRWLGRSRFWRSAAASMRGGSDTNLAPPLSPPPNSAGSMKRPAPIPSPPAPAPPLARSARSARPRSAPQVDEPPVDGLPEDDAVVGLGGAKADGRRRRPVGRPSLRRSDHDRRRPRRARGGLAAGWRCWRRQRKWGRRPSCSRAEWGRARRCGHGWVVWRTGGARFPLMEARRLRAATHGTARDGRHGWRKGVRSSPAAAEVAAAAAAAACCSAACAMPSSITPRCVGS